MPEPAETLQIQLDNGLVYPVKAMTMAVVDPATGQPGTPVPLMGAPGPSIIKFSENLQINIVVESGVPWCMKPPCPPPGTPTTPMSGSISVNIQVDVD